MMYLGSAAIYFICECQRFAEREVQSEQRYKWRDSKHERDVCLREELELKRRLNVPVEIQSPCEITRIYRR